MSTQEAIQAITLERRLILLKGSVLGALAYVEDAVRGMDLWPNATNKVRSRLT